VAPPPSGPTIRRGPTSGRYCRVAGALPGRHSAKNSTNPDRRLMTSTGDFGDGTSEQTSRPRRTPSRARVVTGTLVVIDARHVPRSEAGEHDRAGGASGHPETPNPPQKTTCHRRRSTPRPTRPPRPPHQDAAASIERPTTTLPLTTNTTGPPPLTTTEPPVNDHNDHPATVDKHVEFRPPPHPAGHPAPRRYPREPRGRCSPFHSELRLPGLSQGPAIQRRPRLPSDLTTASPP